MDDSSPFLSSCTRRQWAKRRGSRVRHGVVARLLPALLATTLVLVWFGAFVVGRGGL
jgi:hypothetical protein